MFFSLTLPNYATVDLRVTGTQYMVCFKLIYWRLNLAMSQSRLQTDSSSNSSLQIAVDSTTHPPVPHSGDCRCSVVVVYSSGILPAYVATSFHI